MTQLTLALDPKPMTDTERVLKCLTDAQGAYVADLYGRTRCMVHSRISDLRKQGHVIEMKRFGHRDYRYRLVAS